MNKIKLFRDQDDFTKKITDDNIINIIGSKGSGKTTSTIEYLDNDDYIVVNCDRLLELPSGEKEDKELDNIRNLLKKKYKEIKEGEEFANCYNDIVDYILNKEKKGIIEGNVIQDIDPSLLKGKVIVKRTAKFKCFIRAVKRDYKNEYFMNLEKESHKYLYKITRLFKITKRRLKIFKQTKEIDEAIEIISNKKGTK